MSKKFKTLILTALILFAGFLVVSNSALAACALSNPRWSPSVADIGQEVTMTVQTSGCDGINIEFDIKEDDTWPLPDDDIRTVNPAYRSSALRVATYAFTAENYNKGKGPGESRLSMYFIARALDSSRNEINRIKSANLSLNPPSDDGGDGPDDEGEAQPCLDPEGEAIPCPGEDVEVEFNIPNPIAAESLIDLAKAIGRFLFQIAIPIAVIIIIYAGLLYLTSGGKTEQVKKATTALKFALIGLTIILIGQGFFTLIKSILDLGGPAP